MKQRGIFGALFAWVAGLAIAQPAMAWTEHALASGELHGTLTLPGGGAPAPAVLILAGSGPVDRDGNLPNARNDSLKLLAHGLADYGIASLRIDKRGIGQSPAAVMREEDLRLDTYVTDALAWADFLRAQPRIASVALLGHSEGALVATLAAQRTRVSGLVLLAGAGEPVAKIIARQLAASGAPAALQDASRRIAADLEQGKQVLDVPVELSPLYRPSVQNYLMSWLPLDPAIELARVDGRVLIVQGTTDLQIGVEDARRLAAVRPGAQLVLIEGMNHVLKNAPAERVTNLLTYRAPETPLAPSLVPAIAAFLQKP